MSNTKTKLRKYGIDYFDVLYNEHLPMSIAPHHGNPDSIVFPDEVIIKAHTIEIEYDYPLSGAVRFKHTNRRGWTRKRLFKTIQRDYVRIYREEDDPNSGLESSYGIWGHDIGDLVLEEVIYDPDRKLVTLGIGS